MTPYVIFALRFFSLLFYPILLVFTLITRLLAKLAGGAERNPFTLREEIMTMLQLPAASHGDIEPGEQAMIRRTFNFTETQVRGCHAPSDRSGHGRRTYPPAGRRDGWLQRPGISVCRSTTGGWIA